MRDFYSFSDRDSLLDWIDHLDLPQFHLTCNFQMKVTTVFDAQNLLNVFPLTSLNIPSLGIEFGNSSDSMGYPTPSLKTGDVSLSYISAVSSNLFKTIWENQFDSGVLKFIKKSEMPKISIFTLSGEKFLDLEGVRVSHPQPTINLSQDEISVFSLTLSFFDYKLYTI